MLQLFRRYQRWIFSVTALIVVASSAFFGTFRALLPQGGRGVEDPVVYVTPHKATISKSYLDQFVRFLSEEKESSSFGAPRLFSNYLNEGLCTAYVLRTEVGYRLIEQGRAQFEEEFRSRLEQEKQYRPFVHEHLPMVSARQAWTLFAPEIPQKLEALQKCADPLSPEGFKARVELLLAERNFPPTVLTQILRYQEREAGGMDPRLHRGLLALFGHRNLEDWLGRAYLEAVAKLVIDVTERAERSGYRMSDEEALYQIGLRTEGEFKACQEQIAGRLPSPGAYFAAYLQHSGFDRETFLKIWKRVQLFERFLSDMGSALIDPLPLQEFMNYAGETLTVDLEQMAPEFCLKSVEDLELFEAYLQALGGGREKESLALPMEIDSLEQIQARAPALVGERFILEIGKTDKTLIAKKVPLRVVWEWQLSDGCWSKLLSELPALGDATTQEERYAHLGELSDELRKRLDLFAARDLVDAHPEWITEELGSAKREEKMLFLSGVERRPILPGITDAGAFLEALHGDEELSSYSQDGEIYYTVRVKQRPEGLELLSFPEAKRVLERVACPNLLKALYAEALASGVIEEGFSKEELAPLRFLSYLQKRERSQLFPVYARELEISRGSPSFLPFEEALTLVDGEESPLRMDPEQGVYHYRVVGRHTDRSVPLRVSLQLQEFLAQEAKERYLLDVLCSPS